MTRAERFTTIAASLLLTCASLAQAQVAKKYVTPDGRIIYSDVPVPGAREVGEVAPPQRLDPQGRSPSEEGAPREAEHAREAEQRARESSAREERIREAEAQLEAARDELANGKEPLPGERVGTAGGNSRLTEAYFERQAANERAVKQAQEELEAARAGR